MPKTLTPRLMDKLIEDVSSPENPEKRIVPNEDERTTVNIAKTLDVKNTEDDDGKMTRKNQLTNILLSYNDRLEMVVYRTRIRSSTHETEYEIQTAKPRCIIVKVLKLGTI